LGAVLGSGALARGKRCPAKSHTVSVSAGRADFAARRVLEAAPQNSLRALEGALRSDNCGESVNEARQGAPASKTLIAAASEIDLAGHRLPRVSGSESSEMKAPPEWGGFPYLSKSQ
jgi:hypothetical protein